MLSFSPEWHDAPGVKDSVLAATWARLEIQAADEGSDTGWPSSVISAATGSVRRGIYGSLFPLAEWIVENWWFLLNEPCRVPDFTSGRQLAADPSQRGWAQRHNLLAAREGGALPDLTIYRDGEQVVAKWAPDPKHDERVRPVRFIEQGSVVADPADVERSLHQFVEAVLERLVGSMDDSTGRLRANWNAVCESRQSEPALCSWSAALGLDPYNDDELSDELIDLIQSRVSKLRPELQQDLVDASAGDALKSDLDWLDRALSLVSVGRESSNGRPTTRPTTAHQLGYQQAASFRQQFALPEDPISDLSALLHEKCGWPAPNQQTLTIEGTANVSALVAKDPNDDPRLIGPPLGHWAERFRLARSLYFLPDVTKLMCPRLVTRAYTWDQRASRAFAAELLAPAQALRAQVDDVVTADDVDQLARQFDVRPNLIEHQIKNHHLAWIDED